MKIVTLQEAIASGRPFRYSEYVPNSHSSSTGHVWRLFRRLDSSVVGTKTSDGALVTGPVLLQCTECHTRDLVAQCADMKLDTWIIQKSEDEFESDAQDIIEKLGLKIEDEAKA